MARSIRVPEAGDSDGKQFDSVISNHVIINRTYTFAGSEDDLIKLLNNSDLPCAVMAEDEIEFYSKELSNEETFDPALTRFFPVKANLYIIQPGIDYLRIRIKTSIRPEHYIIAVAGILYFVLTMSGYVSVERHNVFMAAWPVLHLWIHFIRRMEESTLINRIVRILRLTKN